MPETITAHERQQVDRANLTGRTPVVFVHGLWLLPSSWDRWATLFETHDFPALTPGWPDDPETVEEANAHPEALANKSVGQVADHFGEIIRALHKRPVVVGHSFGGPNPTEILEMKNRGHALTIDSGWREVADTALAFLRRFVPA